MPLKDANYWNIVIHYKDGTTKTIGPYSGAIAHLFASLIALKPWVRYTEAIGRI